MSLYYGYFDAIHADWHGFCYYTDASDPTKKIAITSVSKEEMPKLKDKFVGMVGEFVSRVDGPFEDIYTEYYERMCDEDYDRMREEEERDREQEDLELDEDDWDRFNDLDHEEEDLSHYDKIDRRNKERRKYGHELKGGLDR